MIALTAYDIAERLDFDRLEKAAHMIAVETDPAGRSDLDTRIYDALVEALRHVEVSA